LRVILLGRFGAGTRSARREGRFHRTELRIPVGAKILRKQRVADTALWAPNPTQRLKLTVQTAAVRTMTLEARALAGRIGTEQLGDPFKLCVPLAADTRQA
jgi:hypothetical protein